MGQCGLNAPTRSSGPLSCRCAASPAQHECPRSVFCSPGPASVSHRSLAKHPLDTRVPPPPLATQSSLRNQEGPHPPVIRGRGDIECQRRHNRLSLSLQLSLDLYSRRHRMASHGRSGQNTLEGHPARKKRGWERSLDHLGLVRWGGWWWLGL